MSVYTLPLRKGYMAMQDIVFFMQHHLALVALFAFVLILLFVLEFIKLKRGANKLTPAQTTQLINHNNAVVVDVRTQDAFLSGHIVNAISLPLSELNNKIKKIEKFKMQPIVVVCGTGIDAAKAAGLLTQQGFLQTQILAGGIRAWRDAELPLVKG